MIHDVMVIGAGAAGATAAVLSALQGQRVVLFERARRQDMSGKRPDWLTPPGLGLLDELGVDCSGCVGKLFDGAAFHTADLDRSAEVDAVGPPACRVDYGQLVSRLGARAAKAGVECVYGTAPVDLEAGEDHVTATFDDRDPVEAKFLIIADGAGGDWRNAGAVGPRWIATMRAGAKKSDRDDRMHWILGLGAGRSLGCWWFDRAKVVIRLYGHDAPESAREQFKGLVSRVCENGLLPANLEVSDSMIGLRSAPARGALELDSHVDKRALRIGDAGGFVAAASREGIYPAMWSARLAVDVIVRAADSRHPQDELRQFGALWRTTMGEYLRPPNTDTQFLLPLIFSNQQMAYRMAAAFWSGKNI